MDGADALREALDREDIDAAERLLLSDPELHRASVGYRGCGPLTWATNRWSPRRLAFAAWLIDHGSDVHQGGDAPLMRAALNAERVPMMALLVERGADVNARCGGGFPILYAPCETVDPIALQWLLDHGARPDGALDYLLGSYVRSSRLADCIDRLLKAGATTRFGPPAVLDLLRGRLDALAQALDAAPDLVYRPLPGLDIGTSGGRLLTLADATLLHLAAEFGAVDAARLLLERGADPNALGGCGQTPLFHAVTQFDDAGLAMTECLLAHGADPRARARVPGHYERPDEWLDLDVAGYAERFPGPEFGSSNAATRARLREALALC